MEYTADIMHRSAAVALALALAGCAERERQAEPTPVVAEQAETGTTVTSVQQIANPVTVNALSLRKQLVQSAGAQPQASASASSSAK